MQDYSENFSRGYSKVSFIAFKTDLSITFTMRSLKDSRRNSSKKKIQIVQSFQRFFFQETLRLYFLRYFYMDFFNIPSFIHPQFLTRIVQRKKKSYVDYCSKSVMKSSMNYFLINFLLHYSNYFSYFSLQTSSEMPSYVLSKSFRKYHRIVSENSIR